MMVREFRVEFGSKVQHMVRLRLLHRLLEICDGIVFAVVLHISMVFSI